MAAFKSRLILNYKRRVDKLEAFSFVLFIQNISWLLAVFTNTQGG